MPPIAGVGAERGATDERANYQLFIGELCELLDLPRPDPAKSEAGDNLYVFERRVTFRHGDGIESAGFLSRCLLSMFAEDVELLPKQDGKGAFTSLLESLRDNPAQFVPLDEIGHTQAMLETEGLSVDPHQFLGLEINPRAALGDGYVEALRSAWSLPSPASGRGAGGEGGVPESADFVMYWWRIASCLSKWQRPHGSPT